LLLVEAAEVNPWAAVGVVVELFTMMLLLLPQDQYTQSR
jgi:hypothetical protein